MTTAQRPKSRDPRTELLGHWIVEGIRDIKGKNIVQLDLRHLDDAPADFFIICEGDSNTQVKAISDGIYKRVKEELHTLPAHVEGSLNARWILIDYFDVIVHVFYPETRAFYDIEHLWSDAKFTEYADI
ncbi:MAG: ribosome silencing factor [Saprospiraceae bacterium]|nr:ribosome silencing factor [Saprospiraceae bacterium]